MKRTLEDYSEILKALYTRNLFSKGKYDLSRIASMVEKIGHPERQFRSIHVGGTNGKGSVTTKIASALEKEGYRVGLFTSPHIASFCERIQINSEMIPMERATALLAPLLSLDKEATFFELTCALGLLYFAEEKVDFALIEVGLGGRLDATNVLTPELAVITSIGLDHTEILGNTIEEILEEKKAIIKPPSPCVLGPRVPRFTSPAPLFWASSHARFYDEENQATAKMALSVLQKKFPISEASIEYGLERRPPCRLEWVRDDLVLDVAHNPDGFRALCEALPRGKKCFLVAISKEKDLAGILREISRECDFLVVTEAKNGRSYPVGVVEQEAMLQGFSEEKIMKEKNPEEALQIVLESSLLKVVAGSFFIMGDVKKALGFAVVADPMDMNERSFSFFENKI